MSIIDTDIDTDRRQMMKRKTNREIATAHGIAQIFKRGDNWNYTITLDIKKIPTDKRRLRRTLGYISADCVEEKVKLDIAKLIKENLITFTYKQ